MENSKIKKITEDEFLKKFNRQKNHFNSDVSFDGCMFETFGEELEYVFEMSKQRRVLTIIEGDNDSEISFISDNGTEITEPLPNMFYLSGFHLINRIGYFVLDKPYKYNFEVIVE